MLCPVPSQQLLLSELVSNDLTQESLEPSWLVKWVVPQVQVSHSAVGYAKLNSALSRAELSTKPSRGQQTCVYKPSGYLAFSQSIDSEPSDMARL